MADEVLGISASMDISDIQKSINELISQMNRLDLKTEELSKNFNSSFEKIQASSADSATKHKQSMELFETSIEQAKKQMATLPEQIRSASKEVLAFNDSCVAIKNKMLGLKVGSDEFANLNRKLQQNMTAAETAARRHDELSNSFNSLTSFIANASASIDTFNGLSTVATGATGINAVSHGAVTAALAGETVGRAANTDAIGKETEAISENSQASRREAENIEKKKDLMNEYSSALDAITEKLRSNQQVSEQQIQNEISSAKERIRLLEEEKAKKEESLSIKYSEYERYSNEALLGDPSKKEENLSKAREAVDAYNRLGEEIYNTDKAIREISSSINTLTTEISYNSDSARSRQEELTESMNQTRNAAAGLDSETKRIIDNDPWGVQGRSVEYLTGELAGATKEQEKLNKELEKAQEKVNHYKDNGKTEKEEEYRKKVIQANDGLKQQHDRIKAIIEELKKQGVEVDNNTGKIKKQTDEISSLLKQLKGGFGGGVGGMFNTLLSGKFLGWAAAIGSVAKGLWDSSKASEEYRKSLMTLKHYMDNVDFKTVRRDILALTESTTKSASDMAGAATYFAKVWESLRTSPDGLITMVKAANEFASLSGKTSSESAKSIAELASEYHLTAQEAIKMSTIIVNASKNSTSSFSEMSSAISSSGSQAKLYGVSFKEMATLIGYSANQFGGASKAASRFNMMLMTMNGLESKFRPSAVGMVKALENLKDAYDKGERPQDKFMKRQRAAVEYFIKNADAIKKYGESLDNAVEKTKLLSDKQTTAEVNLAKLKNTWNGLLTSMNVNLTPILTNVIKFFNSIIGGVQKTSKELRALEQYEIFRNKNKGNEKGKVFSYYVGVDVDKGTFIHDYEKQEKILSARYKNAVEKYQKIWKDATPGQVANAASNEVLRLWKSKQTKYYTIDANEINRILGDYRKETIALNTKPINTGDTGDGGNNGEKELKEQNKKAKREEDLLRMQRQERLETEKQSIVALQEERNAYVASIKNDAEREIEAMKAAHQSRMEQIKQQEKDMIESNVQKAAQEYQKKHENDKSYKGFYTQGLEKQVTLTNDQVRQINALYSKEASDYARMIEEKKSKDDEYRLQYLEKYGYTYSQRAAIAEKYEKQIAKATSEWQKKILEKEKENELSSFDLKQFQENINWDAMLGDVSRYTKKALQEVREQIKKFMETDEFKALNPSDKQVIIQGLQRIENETNVGLPFREYAESLNELREAKREYENARYEKETIGNNSSLPDEIRQKAYENEEEAKKRLKNAQDKVSVSGSMLNDRLILVASAFTKLGSSASLSLSEIGGAITGLLQGLNVIPEKVGGIIGAIIGIMDMINQQGLDGFAKNIGNSLATLAGRFMEFSPAGIVAKAFGFDFGIGGPDNSSWQEADKRYKDLSEVWDSLISKKKEYLNMSWGVEAQNISEEILDLIDAETKALKIAADERLGAGKSSGSHSYWYRMWKGSYDSKASDNKGGQNKGTNKNYINWRDVNHAVEKGLKDAGLGDVTFESMYDMINMTADQLTWIKTNYSGLWAKMDTTFKGYLEELITYGEQAQDTIQALKEQLIGTSFDTVFDDALNALNDYANGVEDVFDNLETSWQKMINKMVVNNLVGNELKKSLEGWYEKLNQAYTDDGEIDLKEIEELRKDYDEIIETEKKKVDSVKEMGIVKEVNDNEQSATAKAISNITYDQANVMDGRLTTIQICVLKQLEEEQKQTDYQERIGNTVSEMIRHSRNIDSNISQIIDIQTDMRDYLSDISTNTRGLPQMAIDIANMKKKVSSL